MVIKMTKLIAAALVAIMLLVTAAGCSQPAPDQYESTERNEIIYKSIDGTDLDWTYSIPPDAYIRKIRLSS